MKTTTVDKRKPAFITDVAHADLTKLADLLTQYKGVRISYIDAASIAISNETRRLERREQRRRQRESTVAA